MVEMAVAILTTPLTSSWIQVGRIAAFVLVITLM